MSTSWLVGAVGIRTIKRTDATQVIDSTFRSIRNNRQNRMSEVHGGDTEARMQPSVEPSTGKWDTIEFKAPTTRHGSPNRRA